MFVITYIVAADDRAKSYCPIGCLCIIIRPSLIAFCRQLISLVKTGQIDSGWMLLEIVCLRCKCSRQFISWLIVYSKDVTVHLLLGCLQTYPKINLVFIHKAHRLVNYIYGYFMRLPTECQELNLLISFRYFSAFCPLVHTDLCVVMVVTPLYPSHCTAYL